MTRTEPAPAAADFWTTRQRQGFALVTAFLLLYVNYEALRPRALIGGTLHIDKVLHFGAFFWLALTSAAACKTGPRSLGLVATSLLAYGAAIELLQMRIPGRDASWADFAADGLGIVAGLGSLGLLNRWRTRRKNIF